MTTTTTDLASWLLARIADDEAAARAATPGPWEVGDWWHIQGASHCRCDAGPLVWAGVRDINGTRMPAHVHRRREPIGADIMQADASDGEPADVSFGNDFGPGLDGADAAHIAIHDPARALAQCEALRAVVALHVVGGPTEWRPDQWACRLCQWDEDCDAPKHDHQYGAGRFPCPTLRALARIWRDHEAFDPSRSA